MTDEHLFLLYDAVPYDEVAAIFPVSSLPSRAVAREADAAQLIEATADEAILAVAPVSTATGYRLAQAPLTAVRLDRLDRAGPHPSTADLLVFGRAPRHRNHILAEYA